MTDRDPLTDLLDTLLPGDGQHWPAAGRHGLTAKTRDLAQQTPGAGQAIATVLAALPSEFGDLSQDDRETILKEIETAEPHAFEMTLTAAYNAYYTDPGIRDAIERLTGYENRPPQPKGYALPDFDEGLLDQVKARGPIWRPVPDE